MGKLCAEKSYKKFDSKSKYQMKQKRKNLENNLEHGKKISSYSEMLKQKHNYDFYIKKIKMSNGIITRINYFPNPIALQVVSCAIQRDVYSLIVRPDWGERMYSLKQSGYSENGRGERSLTPTFKELYIVASWLTPL